MCSFCTLRHNFSRTRIDTGFAGVILYKMRAACDDVCSFVFFSYIYRGMRQSMTPEALQPCKFVTKVVTKWAKNARFLGWFCVWRVFYCVAVRFCVIIWAKNAPYLYHKMPAGCWCGIFVYKNGLNCGQKMPEI